MSVENVGIVRRGYEAFARGDVAALLALADEEVEWYPVIAPVLGLGPIRGKTALEEFFTVNLAEGFAEIEAVAVAVEDLGKMVLVQTHYSGHGRTSGVPTILDVHTLVRFRNGKIASYWDYETRADALEAAGLSE
jgi:uncharacterized protein